MDRRKIKSYKNNKKVPADIKPGLDDGVNLTMKLVGKIIDMVRRIFSIAIGLVGGYPNAFIGLAVGSVLGALVSGWLGALTIFGFAPFAPLGAILFTIFILIGVISGFVKDISKK